LAHSGSRRTRIAALIGGLIVAAAPARAADVPASAYSVAVQTPIVLLDDANLVYLFPQHGTSLATQLQMSANGSSAHAAGGNMRFGRQAGFLLGHTSRFGLDSLSGTLAQTGFATGGDRWRAGVALRGSRHRDSRDNRDDQNEVVTRVDFRESTVDYTEAALGVSWFGERSFVDVLVEAIHEDSKVSSFYASSSDTSGFDGTTDTKIVWRGAARLAIPVSPRTEVRAWGSFRDQSTTWDYVQLTNSVVDTSRTDLYGHQWSVALAVVHAPDETSLTRAYARYDNSRPPEAPDRYPYGSSFQTERTKSDVVRAGFSLERPIWWELRFLAGFAGSFVFHERVSTRLDSDGDVDKDVTTTESLSQSFSWGLRREINAFDLTASLRTDLALTALFVYLDAKIRLP
jgi:hypothetical protein